MRRGYIKADSWNKAAFVVYDIETLEQVQGSSDNNIEARLTLVSAAIVDTMSEEASFFVIGDDDDDNDGDDEDDDDDDDDDKKKKNDERDEREREKMGIFCFVIYSCLFTVDEMMIRFNELQSRYVEQVWGEDADFYGALSELEEEIKATKHVATKRYILSNFILLKVFYTNCVESVSS